MSMNPHRAAMDYPSDAVPQAGRQNNLRPGYVDVPVVSVREAGRAVRGGKVEYDLRPLNGAIHRRRIADIATGDLHADPAEILALGRITGKHAHGGANIPKASNEMAPRKSVSAGHQYLQAFDLIQLSSTVLLRY